MAHSPNLTGHARGVKGPRLQARTPTAQICTSPSLNIKTAGSVQNGGYLSRAIEQD